MYAESELNRVTGTHIKSILNFKHRRGLVENTRTRENINDFPVEEEWRIEQEQALREKGDEYESMNLRRSPCNSNNQGRDFITVILDFSRALKVSERSSSNPIYSTTGCNSNVYYHSRSISIETSNSTP